MKKFYFFLVIAIMAMATSASAQFVQSGANNQSKNNNQSGNFFSQMSTDNYSRIYVGYNPTKIKWEDHQSELETGFPLKHGISLGYIYGANIVDSLPLYLEFGGNFQYSFGKEEIGDDYESIKYKLNMYSLNVPVNLAFRFGFNDNKVEITPYLGLNFRVNLAGNMKLEYEYEDDYYGDSGSYDVKLFDDSEEEMGQIKSAFKRFQVGFNVGVNFAFSGFNIGVGYTTDFNKICSALGEYDGKLGVTTLSVGFAF
ncbi:MAG: outer membrane beta-barrel protein [Alistipes sp.]|nr:outer membrane beta-barrel protein [Alistipes sp.]